MDEPEGGTGVILDETDLRPVRRRRRRRRKRRLDWFRRHKALTVLIAAALALLLGVLIWIWWLHEQLDDVRRFPMEIDHKVERVAGESMNILVMGVDDVDGLRQVGPSVYEMLESGEWEPGVSRSDTLMVLHLSADRRSAQLISIPRDSYVDIPGHGRSKINAAFSWGGPELAAETIEKNFGIYLDHAVIVDFDGFKDITEVLGGVNVHVDETVVDPMRDKTWTRGWHHIQGEDALAYVRMRYGLQRGDFDRIHRQQNFLRAVLDKATDRGIVYNPVKVSKLAGKLSKLVLVDEEMSNGKLRDLAVSSRHLRSSSFRFVTIPTAGTATIDGASVVKVRLQAARELFAQTERDRFEIWYNDHQVDELPPDGKIR